MVSAHCSFKSSPTELTCWKITEAGTDRSKDSLVFLQRLHLIPVILCHCFFFFDLMVGHFTVDVSFNLEKSLRIPDIYWTVLLVFFHFYLFLLVYGSSSGEQDFYYSLKWGCQFADEENFKSCWEWFTSQLWILHPGDILILLLCARAVGSLTATPHCFIITLYNIAIT